MANELTIQVGVELNTQDLQSQLKGITSGTDTKIKVEADVEKAKKSIEDLKKSLDGKTPVKLTLAVDTKKAAADINNFIKSFKAQNIKIGLEIDPASIQKVTEATQKIAQQAQEAQAKAAASAAGKAATGGAATGQIKLIEPNAEETVNKLGKYGKALHDAIRQYMDAFGDETAKLSRVNIKGDIEGATAAVVEFNNALGETTRVMFKPGENGWEMMGDSYTHVFKDATKDVEHTLDILQKLQDKLNAIQSKGFDRTNKLSGTYAEPVNKEIAAIQARLDEYVNRAKNGSTATTNEEIRELNASLTKLDLLRIQQQNTQYQARQMSATDVGNQVEILKNNLAALQNELKDVGLFDIYKSKIEELGNALATMGKDGGATVSQWQSQWRELISDINGLKSSPRGQGIMEAAGISDNQLEKIKSIKEVLDAQGNTAGIQAMKIDIDELAAAYEDLQKRMQSSRGGKARLALFEREEAELDAKLKSYQAIARNLNGDAKSQQWMAQQEAGIAKMSTEFEQYFQEIEKTVALTPELKAQLYTLKDTFGKEGAIDVTNWKEINAQFTEFKANVEAYKGTFAGQVSLKQFEAIDGMDKTWHQLSDIMARAGAAPGMEQYSGVIATINEQIDNLALDYSALAQKFGNPDLGEEEFKELSAELDKLNTDYQTLAKTVEMFNGSMEGNHALEAYTGKAEAVEQRFEKLKMQYADLIAQNPQIAASFQEIENAIAGMNPGNIDIVNRGVSNLGNECKMASGQVGGLREALQGAFGSAGGMVAQLFSAYQIINKVIGVYKNMINEVRGLDTSMMELTKVTNLSGDSLDAFVDKAFKIGSTLGRTGKDVMDATTTFSRAGYNLQESVELSKAALVMTNVGVDIPNMESAASDMISILRAYDKEANEAMDVVSQLYNVANKEPLDFGNITDMLVTAGGTLSQTGTSLEQTMALLTGGFATLRDTSVANGLVMISQRLRGVKEDGEAIEEAGFMPKLKAAFGEVGVAIEDENGELRSTYDILSDLADVWDTLSTKQRQFLGEKAAGNRQVKVLNAIMANWDVVKDTLSDADNSEGAALEGNTKFMDSFEGKVTAFQSAFSRLSKVTVESGVVKWFIDLGTAIVNITTAAGGLTPVITAVTGAFVAFNAIKIANGIKEIGKAFLTALKGASGFGAGLTGWIGIALTAVSIIAMIVNAVNGAKKSFSDLQQESSTAKQTYADQQDKVATLNKKLRDTQTLIDNLNSKGKLSIVEQDELTRLEGVTRELETQIALEKERTRIAQYDARKAAVNAVVGYQNESTDYYAIPDRLESVLGRDYIEENIGRTVTGMFYSATNAQLANLDILAIPRLKKRINELKSDMDSYISQGGQATDAKYQELLQDLNTFEGYYDETLSSLNHYRGVLLEQADGLEYVEGAKSGTVEAGFNNILDTLDIIDQVMFDASDYKTQMDEFNAVTGRFKKDADEITKTIKKTGNISAENLASNFPDMIEAFSEKGWDPEKVAAYFNEIYGETGAGSAGNENESKERIQLLASGVASEIYTASEAYETLTKAIGEQNQAGILSATTVAELIGQDAELIKYLDLTGKGYKLNTDSLMSYIDTMNKGTRDGALVEMYEAQQRLNELLDYSSDKIEEFGRENYNLEVSGLQNEIAYWTSIIREIDGATDALARYRAAKETPNQDTDHNTGIEAYQDLQEGLETGKIGTDDFGSAVDFLLGDGWEERFDGDLNRAFKAASEIGEKYFGKDDSTSADKFATALVDNGFAEYDDNGGFQLLEKDAEGAEVTIDSIAEKLGMSSEAAMTLFGLLETYSWGQSFEFPEVITDEDVDRITQLKDLGEVEDQLEQTKTKIAELEQQRSETEEGSEEYDSLTQQLTEARQAKEALEEQIEILKDNGGTVDKTTPLEDLQTQVDSLTTAFEYLNTNGLEIPVALTGQWDQLRELIKALTGHDIGPADGIGLGNTPEPNDNGETPQDSNASTSQKKAHTKPSIPDLPRVPEDELIEDSAEAAGEKLADFSDTIDATVKSGEELVEGNKSNARANAQALREFNEDVGDFFDEDTDISEPMSEVSESAADAGEQLSDLADTVDKKPDRYFDLPRIPEEELIENGAEAAGEQLSDLADATNAVIESNAYDAPNSFIEWGDQSQSTAYDAPNSFIEWGDQNQPVEVEHANIEVEESEREPGHEDVDWSGPVKENIGEWDLDFSGSEEPIQAENAIIEAGTVETQQEDYVVDRYGEKKSINYNEPTTDNLYDSMSALFTARENLLSGNLTPDDLHNIGVAAKILDKNPEAYSDIYNAQWSDDLEPGEERVRYAMGEMFGNIIQDAFEKGPDVVGEIESSIGRELGSDSSWESIFKPELFSEEQTVPVSGDTTQLESDIEDATETEPSPVQVEAETDGYEQAIDDATPEVENVEVEAETTPTPTPSQTPTVNYEAQVEDPAVKDEQATINYDADTSSAKSALSNFEKSASSPISKSVNIDTGSAAAEMSALEQQLSKPITKVVQIQTQGSVPSGTGLARGTSSAHSGLSLVDEEGAELIEHTRRGTFELGTDTGARFTKLDQGDVVHTAEETKRILNRAGGVGGFFRDGLNQAKSVIGNAFATGVRGGMDLNWLKKRKKKENSSGNNSGNNNSSGNSTKDTSNNTSKKKSKSKNKKGKNSFEDWLDSLFDWAEIRLERLKTITETWIQKATAAVKLATKNKYLDKALKNVGKEITATTAAYNLYMKQADAVAKKVGLSSDIVKKIQNGDIRISEYDEDTRKKIEEYKEWYDKAKDCTKAIAELKEQQKELARQKLDNIIKAYDNRLNRVQDWNDIAESRINLKNVSGVEITEEDYAGELDYAQRQINLLTTQRTKLQKEFEKLVKKGYIKKGSDDWYEYTSKIDQANKALIDANASLVELQDTVSRLELQRLIWDLDGITASADRMTDFMSLHAAQRIDEVADSYKDLIDNGMEQIENLEAQNRYYREQQKGLDVLSDKYQQLQANIESNDRAIMSMKVSQEQWNDSIIDLQITKLQKFKDMLGKTNDQYERQKDLQEAIRELEEARSQKTQRVFVEGQGFVYQQDEDKVREAQENLESVIQHQLMDGIGDLIDALEDFKGDTNVYDENGVLLGSKYEIPQIGALNDLLTNYYASNTTPAMQDFIKAMYNQVTNSNAVNNNGISLNFGDINLNEVKDANTLAQAILSQLPNALLQAMNKK